MRRASTMMFALFTCCFLLPLTAWAQLPGGSAEAKKLKNPMALTPDSIKAGEATFQKYCKFCHGADAKGDGPMAPKGSHPANLTDEEWVRGSSDGEIFSVIREGAGPEFVMKGFKSKLTEKEMWNVVNYLRSIGPKGNSR
jgi:mono/diheme cytochrome c family protein